MPSRDELLAAGPRAYLIVGHRMQVPMATPDGVRTVNQWLNPGDLLPRADWDRFPDRSRGTMVRTGYVRDPLTVQIDPLTGQPENLPPPREAKVVLRQPRTIVQFDLRTREPVTIQDPGGIDRRQQRKRREAPSSGETKVILRASRGPGDPGGLDPTQGRRSHNVSTGQTRTVLRRSRGPGDPGGMDATLQARQIQTIGGGATVANLTDTQTAAPPKRKRGRPRKLPQEVVIPSVPKRRGRPPKG